MKKTGRKRHIFYIVVPLCILGLAIYAQTGASTGFAQQSAQQSEEHIHEFRLRKAVWLTGYDDDFVFHEDVNIQYCECGEIITEIDR